MDAIAVDVHLGVNGHEAVRPSRRAKRERFQTRSEPERGRELDSAATIGELEGVCENERIPFAAEREPLRADRMAEQMDANGGCVVGPRNGCQGERRAADS